MSSLRPENLKFLTGLSPDHYITFLRGEPPRAIVAHPNFEPYLLDLETGKIVDIHPYHRTMQ